MLIGEENLRGKFQPLCLIAHKLLLNFAKKKVNLTENGQDIKQILKRDKHIHTSLLLWQLDFEL